MINSVRKIVLPVEDQDRAIDFWVNRIGLRLDKDVDHGPAERWIEVSLPTGGISLVLSKRDPANPRPEVPEGLPHSPVFFNSPDIQATYAELRSKGVRFATPPVEMGFGWWALFEDFEGTRHALGQW